MDFSEQGQAPGRKVGGIAFVIVLHIIIIYALVTGLARQMVEVIKGPLIVKPIDEVKPPPPKDLPPPPPPPKMVAPPPPFIPPPEVAVETPVAPTITQTTAVAPTTPFVPPQRNRDMTGVKTAAIVNVQDCKPEYPARALRDELEGVTTLSFLIGTNGRVVQTRVDKSSGSRDLDRAAESALSRCKFTPGTVDGQPQESWTKVQYVWKLD